MTVLVVERPSAHVVLLRLNRPEARNALNFELRKAIATALTEAGADPEVRAAVITGSDIAFAAGADLRELQNVTPVEQMKRAVDEANR